MVIAGVIFYFVLVLALLAWWLLPSVRERVGAGLGRVWQAGRERQRAWGARAERLKQMRGRSLPGASPLI